MILFSFQNVNVTQILVVMSKDFSLWRFTLVNRFSLEQIDEVVSFGNTYSQAEKHLRELFPCSLFDVEDCQRVTNKCFVMYGVSNYLSLLS